MTTEERFWKNINKTPDGCWLWTSGKNSKGYGALYAPDHPGKQMYAHRFSWLIHFGPIPDNKFVCHKCDVPNCARPDHLFLGSPLENVVDALAKGRMPQNKGNPEVFKKLWKGKWSHRRGVNHETHKLSNEDVLKIRKLYERGVFGYKKLSTMFPVSAGVIKRIILRQTWKHI